MTLIYAFVFALLVMAGYWIVERVRQNVRRGKAWYEFGAYRLFFIALAALVLSWIVFSIFDVKRKFETPEQKISYGKRTRQPDLITSGLQEKLKKDIGNRDLHYALMHYYALGEEKDYVVTDVRAHNLEGVQLFSYYTELSQSTNDSISDLGNLMLAFWYLEKTTPDAGNALSQLRQIHHSNSSYVQYAMGRAMLEEYGYSSALPYFRAELAQDGYKQGAWQELARIYDAEGQEDSLKKIVDNPESRTFVDFQLRRKVYFCSGNIAAFYGLYFTNMFSTLSLLGGIGALLVLLIWISFLKRLSFAGSISYPRLLIGAGAGSILALGAWLLYAFYDHVLHFDRTGNWGHDFLYCFLGIGVIEELVKIIPFLILLRYTNFIRKPIDYLLFAAATGLGFAFFENMLYISIYGLDVIHARALMASVAHMVFGATAAYGFVLWKYRWRERWWLIPVFFLLAALLHGFYDFWLITPGHHALGIITILFFFSIIVVFISFINNALNQSVPKEENAYNYAAITQQISGFLAGGLTIVFVFEYVSLNITYGSSYANEVILSSFITVGYLIFFLSLRLSNLDIVSGHWAKIQFFSALLPSNLIADTRKRFRNATVGQTFIVNGGTMNSLLRPYYPFSGKVVRRVRLKDEHTWYELKFATPFYINQQLITECYVRTRDASDVISREAAAEVGIFVRVPRPEGGNDKLVFVDWAMMS